MKRKRLFWCLMIGQPVLAAIVGLAVFAIAITASASPGAMHNCPQEGKWAVSVWKSINGTSADEAFAACGEGSVLAAYWLDPDTQGWLRWFPDRPDLSTLTSLDRWQGVIALGGTRAAASPTPAPPAPTPTPESTALRTPEPTAVLSPIPTPTPTPSPTPMPSYHYSFSGDGAVGVGCFYLRLGTVSVSYSCEPMACCPTFDILIARLISGQTSPLHEEHLVANIECPSEGTTSFEIGLAGPWCLQVEPGSGSWTITIEQ